MRVPDEILKCVCFLCVDINGEKVFGGTGFFVSVPSETVSDRSYLYVVTAKHCIHQASMRGGLYLRMNRRDGGSDYIKVDARWIVPDNDALDVAILPWAPDQSKYDFRTVPIGMALGPDVIAAHGIGPGDDVFITGLFTQRYGKQRNLPIIRGGIIAAMPDEPLVDDMTGLAYPAYIAEVRSIGGLSGSPVFVVIGPARPQDGTIRLGLRYFLLGLVRGHWDIKKGNPQAFISDLEHVNMGMALITPIEDVVDLLHQKDFVGHRKAQDDLMAKENAPTLDSAFSEGSEFTQKDFESALRKVSKRLQPSQSDEEK